MPTFLSLSLRAQCERNLTVGKCQLSDDEQLVVNSQREKLNVKAIFASHKEMENTSM